MTQPFVVSLKLTGDGRSAVSAVTSTGQAIEQLNAKTDAAKAKAEALNVALGRRGAAEAGRSGLQATLEAIQAEQRLESARLQAQITEKGRIASINRLAQLGRDAAAASKAIAAAELQVASAHGEAATAARAAATAQSELTVARTTAMRSRQASINAALGIGASSSGDRGADIEAYGRELDALRAKIVPGVAAQQAYKREQDEINFAFRTGAISAREQAAALADLDSRYRTAANSAEIFRARTNAGSANAGTFHTTNLLFQAQDIAMMTAMGQAPMMLAMQQGMQVGGIFHQIGSGKQIVQALGGAIIGLLNPLNLATIATIGLGAAGVQWFMSTLNSAEDATDALEQHREMLESLLSGYDDAKEAADAALESALKLPQGVVVSDLRATLREQAEAQEEVQRRIEANRQALSETVNFLREVQSIGNLGAGAGVDSEGIRQIDLIRQLGIDASSTREELHRAMEAARDLFNTAEDPAIAELADQAYQLAIQLLAVQARAKSADDALSALEDRDIQIRISMSEEFGSAFAELQGLYQDPRSRFEQMREQAKNLADQAMVTATSYGQAVGAANEYQRVLDSINAAEAQANERSNARGAREAQKPFDQWKAANDNFQQRIEQQRLEISLLGKSTYEIERQRAAFDLRNQARAAGIPIDDTVNGQIERMAEQYAGATVELERLQERQRLANERLQFYRGTFAGLFSDMKAGLKDGQTFWEALGNTGANALDKIADRALGMMANGIFDAIFGSLGGGSGSGGGIGGILSAIFNAKGNVYSSPSLSAYSNQIVDRPTLFAFARGAGIMGEAGPEAIMPLTRTASGNLGVRMTKEAGMGISFGGMTFAPVTNIYGDFNMGEADLKRLLDERDRRLLEMVPGAMAEAHHRAVRSAA